MGNKIFLDTNCIIDLIQQRTPNVEFVEKTLRTCVYPAPCIAAPTVTNAYYITKYKNQALYKSFIEKFSIIAMDNKVIDWAFTLRMKDFEDAVQLASALKSNCTHLLTWNKKDFKNCEEALNILTPKEYYNLITA